ncbi:MAG TPA: AbrB/MazE/SpoVT family DNA-binding domain-containing protein [Longimicrobium sp.]
MNASEPLRIDQRGALVLPAELRERFGIEGGSTVLAEATAEGILLRPAVVLPVEIYTPERRAEFLLNSAYDADSHQWALAEVRALGLDSDAIPHERPAAS